MSLRMRLTGAITLVLVGVILAGSVLTYLHAQRKVEIEMEAAMAVAENTVSRRLDELTQRADPALHLADTVAIFDGDRHVSARLIDEGGAILKRSSTPPPANRVPGWFLGLMAPDFQPERIALPATVAPLAVLELHPDPRSEVDEVWGDVRLTLTVLGLFFVAAFSFVWLVIARALRPITALADAFRRIGAGDYGVSVPVGGSPELALLCRGCNRMAERLGEMSSRNRQLSEQIVRVQDEERADVARDLHDEVGPYLFALDVDVAEIERLTRETDAGAAGPAIARKAASARQAAAHARGAVRAMLGRLRPGVLGSLGLDAAIREVAAFHRSRQPDLEFRFDLADRSFGQPVDAAVLAVVREAVVNAVKHAAPRSIAVTVVDLGDEVGVEVTDDGRGFDPGAAGDGYGLVGMRERVEAAGGRMRIAGRRGGRGTSVSAEIPLRAADGTVPADEAREDAA